MMPRKSETFCSYRIRRLQHSGARGDLDFSSPVASHSLFIGCWLVSPPERREASLPVVAVPVFGPALGWFLRLRLGRHVLRRRHADDVTRDAASRHTTTNYQLASLYCAPLKPATQPGGSHKRLKAFSGSKVRRCLKTVSLQMGRGPALSIYSRLNCSASDGQQAMTAKPSTTQLRRWFILLNSLSQMIHS